MVPFNKHFAEIPTVVFIESQYGSEDIDKLFKCVLLHLWGDQLFSRGCKWSEGDVPNTF